MTRWRMLERRQKLGIEGYVYNVYYTYSKLFEWKVFANLRLGADQATSKFFSVVSYF